MVIVGCGGTIWYVTYSVKNTVARVDQRVREFQPPMQVDPQPMKPVVRDIPDALIKLQSPDPAMRLEALRWLALQPVDAARKDDVVAALNKLLNDIDFLVQAEVKRALRQWNGP
jgi:hypothetical protein